MVKNKFLLIFVTKNRVGCHYLTSMIKKMKKITIQSKVKYRYSIFETNPMNVPTLQATKQIYVSNGRKITIKIIAT